MKSFEWYEKYWRKLLPNELPKVGDAWFGGCFCLYMEPRILDTDDCLDPVGMQDKGVFRNPKDKTVKFYEDTK